MADIKVIEGDFTQCSGRYALVVGRFNGFVVESLVEGAGDTLRRHGIAAADIPIVRVPGAYQMASDPPPLSRPPRHARRWRSSVWRKPPTTTPSSPWAQ